MQLRKARQNIKATGAKAWRQVTLLMIVSLLLAACGTDAATATTVAVATTAPTMAATMAPTEAATMAPTMAATEASTMAPTMAATEAATMAPTMAATMAPTTAATSAATVAATAATTGTTTAAAPAPTITPLPAVAQPAGSTKVTFWYGLTGANGNVVRAVINKFNSSQSKYYVEGVQQPNYDDTINKLNASFAGGDLPSVVQIYDVGTQRMIDSGRVKPVQDFIDRDGLADLQNDLEGPVRSYYTVNGKMYSMPFNSSAPVLYYDKNAFKEVGLDPDKPPTTYSEVLAAAQKLTKKDASGKVIRSGIDFTLYGWILEQELATQGVTYADPDNGRTGRATKLVFNRPESENYLNFLKQLIEQGVGRSVGRASGTTNGTTLGANFSRGDAAMAIESIANLRGWTNQAAATGKVDVGVGTLPKPDNAPGGVIIGGASLWITDQGSADQQEGAWQFVKFTAQPDIQAFFASSTGYYPTRKAAYNEQPMKDALAKYPAFQTAIDEMRNTQASVATSGAVFGTFANTRPTVEGAMEQFLLGQVGTAKEALDAAANDANDKLEEYNSTVGQ